MLSADAELLKALYCEGDRGALLTLCTAVAFCPVTKRRYTNIRRNDVLEEGKGVQRSRVVDLGGWMWRKRKESLADEWPSEAVNHSQAPCERVCFPLYVFYGA